MMRQPFVYSETDGEQHNTITPIARMHGGEYELDLAMRNNITTEECPLGVYHPHEQYHHIKKNVFVKVLEDAGVYKCTPEGREAFKRFIKTLGI